MDADRPLPRDAFFVVLALASGATDAFGFLQLGGTFTSVMTGNMVLLALAAARADGALVIRAGSAICGYLAGAALAVRAAGPTYTTTPERTMRRLLRVEIALFVLYAAVFEIAGSTPPLAVQTVMFVIAALALGIQSSAVQSYRASGLSTTFLTGTLTSVAISFAQGRPVRHSSRSLSILAGLLVGAAAAAGLAQASPRAAVVLPLLLIVTAHVIHAAATSADRVAAPAPGVVSPDA